MSMIGGRLNSVMNTLSRIRERQEQEQAEAIEKGIELPAETVCTFCLGMGGISELDLQGIQRYKVCKHCAPAQEATADKSDKWEVD